MTRAVESRFNGTDGRSIATYRWTPEGPARDHLMLLHGLAEHAGRYGDFAAYMTQRGYAVHALDHQGHGKSEGARAVIASYESARADIDHLIDEVRSASGLRGVKLVGHSMGGSLALDYALHHQNKLSGLVLSGPAIGGGVNPVSAAILGLLAKVAPEAGTVELDPAFISRDPAVVAAYRADPLVPIGKVKALTARNMMKAIDRFAREASTLTVPCLLMHGSEDKLVPLAPVRPVFDAIASPDKTVRIYDGLYHEIFNEPEREEVLREVSDWLGAHPPEG